MGRKKVKNKEEEESRLIRTLIIKNKKMKSVFSIMSEAIENTSKIEIGDEDREEDDDDENNEDDDESMTEVDESGARLNSTPLLYPEISEN